MQINRISILWEFENEPTNAPFAMEMQSPRFIRDCRLLVHTRIIYALLLPHDTFFTYKYINKFKSLIFLA